MKKISKQSMMLAMLVVTIFTSCKKILDEKPQNELDNSQMYRNVYDADAAITGIYGKFLGLAERYILLNELRADMLDYTSNADEYIRQLSTHTVSEDNPYASPRPFYEVILNCNDVLKNFDIMVRDNKMKKAEYEQRFSDIGCLRSFLYLQLGIHYGRVPYVTDALESVDAIKDKSNFPSLSFTTLLDSLVNFTERLPYKDPYPDGSTLNVNVDGYQTAKFFINKKCLLGDLYLWQGNYDKAASNYRQVMETATQGTINERYYMQYKMGWSGSSVDHYITYSRAGDATTLVTSGTGWRYMFERPQDNGFDYEWIWAMTFDSKFKPGNPMVKLFSPIGGDYLVKPSKEAMDNWNSQKQRPATTASTVNGLPYDARGRLTWKYMGNEPVVMKYLYNYLDYNSNLPVNLLQKNSKWFLYRQTHLHLRFAEAANRAGRHLLAYGLFNSGIAAAYPATGSDVTNYHNTLWEPYPYNFDARNSGSSGVPYYRSDWYRNLGVRGRANVTNYEINGSDSLVQVENGIINEVALEDGYEGTRWADLLRVAIRRNDPSFLADKVYAKLQKDGVPGADAVRSKLMARNWYLPFKL